MSDGRRVSDPLKDFSTSPARAPDYQLVRLIGADDDAARLVEKKNGVNFGGRRFGGFSVLPLATSDLSSPTLGTSNPLLEIYFWNPLLERFVSANDSFGSLGAGIPFEASVNAHGRLVMPYITGVAGGEYVAVYANCYDDEDN